VKYKLVVVYSDGKKFTTEFSNWNDTSVYLNTRLDSDQSAQEVKTVTIEPTKDLSTDIPAIRKGQTITIGGWHPDSVDESTNHPHTSFEYFLVGLGYGNPGSGMFSFVATDSLANTSTYEAQRDLTEENCRLINSHANALGLTIQWR